VRLIVATAVVGGIALVASYFWLRHQIGRTATALLTRADDFEQQQNWRQASAYVMQFVSLRRGTAEGDRALVRFARLIDKSAETPTEKAKAVGAYYRAMGVAAADELPDLRRRLVVLLLDLKRFVEVEAEANLLLQTESNDAIGLRARALGLYGQIERGVLTGQRDETPSVGEALELALAANPGDVDLSFAWAYILRTQPQFFNEAQLRKFDTTEKRNAQADQIFVQVVERGAKDPSAWLARYRYRKAYGLDDATADLQVALGLGPDNLEVRLTAAADSQSQKEAEARAEAIQHFEHILARIDASNEFTYLLFGQYYANEKQIDQALEVWQRGLEKLGNDHWNLNVQIASALVAEQRWADADARIKVIERLASLTTDATRIGFEQQAQVAREETRDLLRSTWLIRRGEQEADLAQVQQAVQVLERLRQTAKNRGEALALLGTAYATLRQWDAAARAYDEVVRLNPKQLTLRAAAAAAWLAAGQPDEAELRYESLATSSDSGEVWLALAVTRVQQQLRRVPTRLRDWTKFDAALTKAESYVAKAELDDPWRIAFLKADRLLLSSDNVKPAAAKASKSPDNAAAPNDVDLTTSEKVHALLLTAEQDHPDVAALFERLVPTYDRLGDAAGADRALQHLEQLPAPAETKLLVRSRLQASRQQFAEAEATLRQGLQDLPERSRTQIRRELIGLAFAQNRRDQALAQLQEMAAANVADADALYQLGGLLLDDQKLDEAEQQEQRLVVVEGPNGARWKMLRARRLLLQSQGKEDPALAEASRLVTNVLGARPKWATGHVLAGILADKQGDLAAAAAAYGRAVEYGERSSVILKRLFYLLRDKVVESERYSALLGEAGSISSDLAGLQISLAERRGQRQQALELARSEANRHPDDALAQFWLGRLLLTTYDSKDPQADQVRDEALATLTKAGQLDPKSPQIWNGLFAYHLRMEQPEQARALLTKIQQLEELSPAQRLALESRSCMLLNDPVEARRLIDEAISLEPNTADFHFQLAEYLLRDDLPAATAKLREAYRLNPKSDVVRRTLSAVLLAQGTAEYWQEAQKLLGTSDPQADSDADQRLQAQAYILRRSAENLKKAREILEHLKTGPNATATDRSLLAQVYELSGMDTLARDEYRSVAASGSAQSRELAQYVEYLLRHEQWQEATPWLAQLKIKAPDSLVYVTLKTQWLRGMGRAAEIDDELAQFAAQQEPRQQDDAGRTRLYQGLGQLSSQAGRYLAAEHWYRQAVALDSNQYDGLAFALAQQDRRTEALEVCAAAAEKLPDTRPIIIACEVLMVGQATAAERLIAEPLIARALERHPDDVQLLGSVANLRFFEQRHDEAYDLFRKVVRLKPRDLVALNNLATLLGEQPGRSAEAIGYIDEALKQAGQQPALLDTKGTILIHQGKAKEAIPLLEIAVRTLSPDPRFYFHLAVAYHRSGQAARARPALKKALDLGLKEHVLTEGDRRLWSELERELSNEGP